MKRFRNNAHILFVLIILLVFGAVPLCRAEEPQPLRVLVTYGGHGFQQKEFFAMWDALPGVTYTKAEMPKEADLLQPGLENQYDVIVMYDMAKGFTPEQRKAFVALLDTGIGLVSTHHNLGAHRDWPEFTRIIGGKYVFKPVVIDGKEVPKSTFSEGEDISVTVADKEHPITKGLADFEIHDETYGHIYAVPGSHVLLTTDHPKCGRDIAWTRQYGTELPAGV
jgi:type 1 glutamine amidotransferase